MLTLPQEPGALAHTARLIRTEIGSIGEQRIRSMIAGINDSANVQSLRINGTNRATKDVLITSWTDLYLENAHLGLGLGRPSWVRKLGRAPPPPPPPPQRRMDATQNAPFILLDWKRVCVR